MYVYDACILRPWSCPYFLRHEPLLGNGFKLLASRSVAMELVAPKTH